MRLPILVVSTLLLAVFAARASGQGALTLEQAVQAALARNSTLLAARSSLRAASERLPQAKSALLPHLEVSESAERGNQPVFAFGSLLAQRRFTEQDFDVGRLNHPDAIGHHRTFAAVEQTVFDGGAGRTSVTRAEEGTRVAEAELGIAEGDLTVATILAYASIGRATADLEAAAAAVAAALDDRRRAADRRDAGMATEADVLAGDVQIAAMREREIRARAARQLSMAELNALMGAPLDQAVEVADILAPLATMVGAGPVEAQRAARAVSDGPELRRAVAAESVARLQSTTAKAAFIPRVVARGGYELAGPNLVDRASSWQVGGYVRWSLSANGAEAASLREARALLARAGHERQAVEQQVRLGIRRAALNLESAVAREAVGRVTVAQASESQRIVRDRYEAGLATTTDLLRAAEATSDARARHVAARFDVVAARTQLERASGGTPSAIVAAVMP
jgi:outer membrane protein